MEKREKRKQNGAKLKLYGENCPGAVTLHFSRMERFFMGAAARLIEPRRHILSAAALFLKRRGAT